MHVGGLSLATHPVVGSTNEGAASEPTGPTPIRNFVIASGSSDSYKRVHVRKLCNLQLYICAQRHE